MKKRLSLIVAIVLAVACLATLVACSEVQEFTVTLNYGYGEPTQISVPEGSAFTLPTPQREGYTFTGWQNSANQTVGAVVKITADTTFTAQWTLGGSDTPVASTIAVKYIFPEDADNAPSNTTVKAGAQITLPDGPEVDGKQFVAWQSQEGATYQAGGKVTANPLISEYVFTAVYNTVVTVRYSTPAGSTAPESQTVQEGSFVILGTAPVVDGYAFRGWTVNGQTYAEGQAVAATATANGIMVVNSTYKKEVTATFMVGEKIVSTIKAADGDTILLPEQSSAANKIFKGWLQLGASAPVAAGSKVVMTDADSTFEAQFTDAVAVYFYDEAGISIVETQWVEAGGNAVEPMYEYAETYVNWWLTFDGFDVSLENVTESISVHPVYSYVPTEDEMGNLYYFAENKTNDGYLVAFKNYTTGGLSLTELKLPYEHDGKPVTGIYTTQTSVSTVADTQYKKGGFALSSKLERLFIPASFKELGVYAFAQDTALTEVVFEANGNLETISKGAFAQCTALESITIPASVTLIDEKAFTECVSLSEVNFEEGDKPLTFGNMAFSYFGATSMTIGATTKVFAEVPAALTTFEFPARTTKIGQHMFRNNVWFESLTFEQPNGQAIPLTIDNYAFAGVGTAGATSDKAAYSYSRQFTSVTIPARTDSIGLGAFAAQFFVEEVIFEDGCNPTTIGNFAFAQMLSLKTLKLAEGMSTIGNGMFAINKVAETAASAATYYDAEHGIRTVVTSHKGEFGFNTDNLTTVVIPNGVKKITTNAFQGRNAINNLQLADSVETIEATAFTCTAGNNYNTNYVEIVLPYNLKSFGGNAFNGWNNIAKIVINCPYLETLDGAFSNTSYEMCGKDVVFGNINSLTTIKGGAFKNAFLKSVTFESEPLNGLTITGSFLDEAGRNNSTISEIILPANIVSISGSFDGLTNLTEIKFASANEYYSFEQGGLYLTEGSEKTLVTYLYASSLDVVIADGTTAIADAVFKGTNANNKRVINSVTIPETLKIIGKEAFSLTTLESIVIPSNVEVLGQKAFCDSALKNVVCASQVIGDQVFSGCTSLETVVLTENVRDISVSAFNSLGSSACKLSYIKLEGNAVKNLVQGFSSYVKDPVFNGTSKTFKIWVDSSDLISQYSANNIWAQANVSALFTSQTVSIVFGDTTLIVPAGSKLAASQIPSDDSGYVWIDSDNNELSAGITVSAMTLTKAYKLTLVSGDETTTTYVNAGGNFSAIAGKTYFDENGLAFDHTKAIERSMTLTEGESVTVTFGTEVVTLMKGSTLPVDSIPDGVWCAVNDGVSSLFNAATPVTENMILYKAIEIVVIGAEGNRMSFWVKEGTKASAEQLETIVFNEENQRVTKNLEIVDLADITFTQSETYVVRASSKLTFHISDTETTEIWVINSVDITSVIPELPENNIWGNQSGATHRAIGTSVTAHTEYYRYIKFMVFIPKEAAANNSQKYISSFNRKENGETVYYTKYGIDVDLPVLKDGYAFFDEDGVQYTAEQLAKANMVGKFEAKLIPATTEE